MKTITDPDGQSLLFAIAPPAAPKAEPKPKISTEGKTVKAAASSPKAAKKAAHKRQDSPKATVKPVLPEQIEVRPWAQAEIQITASLLPIDESPGGRRVLFIIRTDGMPPKMKFRYVPELASISDLEGVWPAPIAEMIAEYREQITEEVAKRATKSETIPVETTISAEPEASPELTTDPELTTEEAVEPTAQAEAEAEAEPVETAEDNPTPGETDGQDTDA